MVVMKPYLHLFEDAAAAEVWTRGKKHFQFSSKMMTLLKLDRQLGSSQVQAVAH